MHIFIYATKMEKKLTCKLLPCSTIYGNDRIFSTAASWSEKYNAKSQIYSIFFKFSLNNILRQKITQSEIKIVK